MLNRIFKIKHLSLVIITHLIVCCPTTSCAQSNFFTHPTYGLWPQVLDDYKVHYGLYGLPKLILGLGIAGLMANDDFDSIVRDEWQDRLKGKASNNFFNLVDDYSGLSQYKIMIPVYFISAWIGSHNPHPTFQIVGKWGNHSIRALLLGAPQQAFFTELLGSPRPEMSSSKWALFDSNRAVSGHAFYGALPILAAAKLSESLSAKFLFYTLSLLPPLARIHNDKHYASQAFLGWWLALQSVNSVAYSNIVRKFNKSQSTQLIILPKQIYFHYAMQF